MRAVFAHHEAGHALVAVRLGWTVDSITIIPEGKHGASCRLAPLPSLADLPDAARRAAMRMRLSNTAVVRLAGPAAQRRFRPGSRVPAGAIEDREEAERCAVLLAGSPQSERALLRYWHHESRAMVTDNWPAVTAIAAELVQHETVPGEVAHEIIATYDAERAALVRAEFQQNGLPTVEDVERYTADQFVRARDVERRHIAEGLLQAVLHALTIGQQAPLNFDAVDEAVRHHAEAMGLDADAASAKLRSIAHRHGQRIAWRPVMAAGSGATH